MTMTKKSPASLNHRGFVLPMSLWVVAILSLASTYFYTWVSTTLDRTVLLRNNVQGDIDIYNAQSDLLFWLLTQQVDKEGLVFKNLPEKNLAQLKEQTPENVENYYLKLTNTPYATPKVDVSIQDVEGLLNINTLQEAHLMSVLKSYGLDEGSAQGLADKFFDYIDSNNLGSRSQGASDDDYSEAGMPKPTHKPLRSLWELKRVLTWESEKALWKEGALPDLLTTSGKATINVNSAPEKVLATLPDAPENFATTLLKRRSEDISYFKDKKDIEEALENPLPFKGKMVSYSPGRTFRLKLKHHHQPLYYQRELSLEPDEYGRPWQVHYDVQLEGHLDPIVQKRQQKEEETDESDQSTKSPDLPAPAVFLSVN